MSYLDVGDMAGPFEAEWQDGKSAKTHAVRLFVRPGRGEIRICEADSEHGLRALTVWPLKQVRPLAGGPGTKQKTLRLALEPDEGQRLTIRPGPGRDELVRHLGGYLRLFRRRGLRRWAMALAVLWVAAVGLYLCAPLIFSLAAGVIPRHMEEAMGRRARDTVVSALQLLPGVGGINEQAGASPDLLALIQRLEEGAPTDGYVFDVQVLDASFVNAFALPGGSLVVSSALIGECGSPDELAGVLAHEMAHVTQRHGTAALLRQHVLTFLTRMAGMGDNLAVLATSLAESSFSRDQEREADRLGTERLLGAGINPLGLAEFFERLQEDGQEKLPLMRYLASHPPLEERRDNIRRALEAGVPHAGEPGDAPGQTSGQTSGRTSAQASGETPDEAPGEASGETSGEASAMKSVEGDGAAGKASGGSSGNVFTPAMDAEAWKRLRALASGSDAEKEKGGEAMPDKGKKAPGKPAGSPGKGAVPPGSPAASSGKASEVFGKVSGILVMAAKTPGKATGTSGITGSADARQ